MLDKNFKKVQWNTFPTDVFNAPVNPLIVIDKDWLSTYHKYRDEKKIALEEYKEWQLMLFVWQWKMSSDVFEVTKEVINNLLTKL